MCGKKFPNYIRLFLHLLRLFCLLVERYLTSGSLHRTRQDKGSHMLTVITVKLPFIFQFHPHHLLITAFFPSRSQNIWDHKIGLVQYQLKGLLKQEKIWTRSCTTPLQIRRRPDTNTTKKQEREKEKEMCGVPGVPARD
jgi:hypothetical protein